MAVGISCAGSGMSEALNLLEPLLKDAVDFVRQGALIAAAFVLLQQPESKVLCCRHWLECNSCLACNLCRQADV